MAVPKSADAAAFSICSLVMFMPLVCSPGRESQGRFARSRRKHL